MELTKSTAFPIIVLLGGLIGVLGNLKLYTAPVGMWEFTLFLLGLLWTLTAFGK